jgi:putative phosphoribosyl transferase
MRSSVQTEAVRIGPRGLPGELAWPTHAIGWVLFAHGSGSTHDNTQDGPRNRFVAAVLHDHRLGTLLFDLLTQDEAGERGNVFDIALLAQRLQEVMDWLRERWSSRPSWPAASRVGLFGASTGGAAALQAAAARPGSVCAVVARGARADLAAPHLPSVQAPTLLVVGGADSDVLRSNRAALRELHCEKRLEIVPGATHLFDEPGALDAVAHLAADWFVSHAAEKGVR